jgi:hypothetical protein
MSFDTMLADAEPADAARAAIAIAEAVMNDPAASQNDHDYAAQILNLSVSELTQRIRSSRRAAENQEKQPAPDTGYEHAIPSARPEGSSASGTGPEQLLAETRAAADAIISEARRTAEAMVAEAQNKADTLQADAERKHSEIMGTINQQRTVLEGRLEQLRTVEREYRTRLRDFLESQQEALEPRVSAELGTPTPEWARWSSAGRRVAHLDFDTEESSELIARLEALPPQDFSALFEHIRSDPHYEELRNRVAGIFGRLALPDSIMTQTEVPDDDELPAAARTSPPDSRKGQAEQGEAGGDENQDA